MLPMTLQFLIVMIATAINDRLQRNLDYTREEVSVLKEQRAALTGEPSFTARQRRRLAEAGKLLTPDERRQCCQLVKPATILAWSRQIAARKYDSSKARRGRPGKPKDVRKLVSCGVGRRTGMAPPFPRSTASCLHVAGIELARDLLGRVTMSIASLQPSPNHVDER
jgi:hypothetical protein